MLRNMAMVVSYDGTAFHGFQAQPNARTVQGEIERVLKQLTKEEIVIFASGRTDTGVHARGQVFHFKTSSTIPTDRFAIAMNTKLPQDIVILHAREVPIDFHARYDAKRKTYQYTIDNGKFPDLFGRHYRLFVPQKLDVNAMREALAYIVGKHDFTSFTSTKSVKPHHVRTIYEAKLVTEGDFITIELTGDGFTYNMVRIIVGTLIWIGHGKKKPGDMKRILEARDRTLAAPTALSLGLVLKHVEYEIELM